MASDPNYPAQYSHPYGDEDEDEGYYPELDDLRGINLDSLDFEDLDFEELEEPSTFWRVVRFILGAGLLGFLLWFPNTQYFQNGGDTLFFVVVGGSIVFGLFFGRSLWAWMQEAAERYAERRAYEEQQPEEPAEPPPRWVRTLTFLAACGGAAGLIFGVPRGQAMSAGAGGGFNGTWFLTVGGAVVVGGLFWRWLLWQNLLAEQRKNEPEEERRELPPWFKWVSLSVLGILGLLAAFGTDLFGSGTGSGSDLEFAFGGVAFVVGLSGAIWLAKRFDETEKRIQAEKGRRRRF